MPGPAFIEGDAVSLRTVEEEDLDFLQRTVNAPNVRRYLGARDPVNGRQEREWFEERASDDGHATLLVCRGEEPMGTVGVHPRGNSGVNAELGVLLAEEFWGHGYGTEASRLATDYAFREKRFHRVFARVFEGNVGSRRIWEKLGFRHEAAFEEAEFIDGEYVTVHHYAALADDWMDDGE